MNLLSSADTADLEYLKSLQVLYVEDEDAVRDQLAQFLARRCAKVYTAADGKKGWEAFQHRRPDLVVTDILMPVMDGLKMCELIRAVDAQIPLILTTAFEEPRYFHKAIDLGVHHYVVKPVRLDAMEQALLKAARSIRAEMALREVQDRYQLLFKLSNIAISVSQAQATDSTLTLDRGRIIDCNDSFVAMLGYSAREDLLGLGLEDISSPLAWRQTVQLIHEELLVRGFTREYEMELLRVGEIPVPVAAQLILRHSESGSTEEIWAVMRDLTERRQAETQQRLAASVFEHSYEAIMITDAANRIISVNPAFSHITGYQPEEVIGNNPRMLGSGRQSREFYQAMWDSLLKFGFWQGEIWNRRKDGQVFPEWLIISLIRDEEGRTVNYIGTFADISELKSANERIEFLAHYDPLTKLANRVLLGDRLTRALASAQRNGEHVAVLFLDVDRFKVINDTLGHGVGDLLLVGVAERILESVRETDTVARLGGDEFVIVLGELAEGEQAAQVARKILNAIGPVFPLGGHEVSVTPSIGISLYPGDGMDGETLLKHADAAMYVAKQSGRNGFAFYAPAMNVGSIERLAMETQLRRALELNQLELHYQPKADIESGRITGVEALVRWRHPELGMVPPCQFIALAEETGLILSLGAWILREACRQNAAWQRQGLPAVAVAVNLSALEFRQRNLLSAILGIVKDTELQACWLELELTESILLEGAEATLSTLRELKRAGLRLSIDDFGTGYSSLSYLQRFPIDKLKIDQSFVRGLPADTGSAAICSAIVSMAHDLGLSVIAEGVETVPQRDFLRARQCDEAQGFLFGAPVEAAQMETLLKNRLIRVN